MTPWTASREPTAVSTDGHVADSTAAVVTVAGGGTYCLPWAIMRLICRPLMPPSTPISTISPIMEKIIVFFMGIQIFLFCRNHGISFDRP